MQAFIALFALVFLVNSPLQAGVVPGRWEKVDALQPGSAIVVILKAGDRIECTFKEPATDYVILVTLTGTELKIPKSGVRRIANREKYEDPVLDGTLIGLAAGFGGGAAVGWALSERLDITTAVTVPFFGGIGAAIGTFVGYAADKSHKGSEVLYQSAK